MKDNQGFEPITIAATDGVALSGRVYEPRAKAAFTLLILPGIGVPQRVFRHFAAWSAGRGVRVVTVDYRGVGESVEDARAVPTASLTAWAERDAVGALRRSEELAGGPVVLLGHSFGGQALGFSDEFRRVRAAILVGSQFGSARHWDLPGRLRVALYWRVILPLATSVFKMVPGWTGIGEPLPRGVAREWARWGRSRDWSLSHVPAAGPRYAAFDRPLRAYALTDDPIAPPRAVTALLQQFQATPVERIDLSPQSLGLPRLGHLGVFRRDAPESLWADILEYGSEHASARAGAFNSFAGNAVS